MANPFNLSEAASLSLHAMTLIANDSDRSYNVKTLAKVLDASESHLAKLMQKLVKAELLSSSRGPKGGFKLNKPSDKITLLEVYESIEGKVSISGCPLKRTTCPFKGCFFKGLLTELNQRFVEYLKSSKLSDFIGWVKTNKEET